MHTPETSEELAEAVQRAAGHERTISLIGNGTKSRMAGPIGRPDECISTTRLNRVLEYEPRDLTISVEAGLPWRELERLLAANRQMVPLDPPSTTVCTRAPWARASAITCSTEYTLDSSPASVNTTT